MPKDTSSYDFEVNHVITRNGELDIEMKQNADDSNRTSSHLYLNTNNANELVCDKRFLKSGGYTIDGEKDIRIQKPSLVERIGKESILVCIADILLKATDEQFNFILDYINEKKIPLPESNSTIKPIESHNRESFIYEFGKIELIDNNLIACVTRLKNVSKDSEKTKCAIVIALLIITLDTLNNLVVKIVDYDYKEHIDISDIIKMVYDGSKSIVFKHVNYNFMGDTRIETLLSDAKLEIVSERNDEYINVRLSNSEFAITKNQLNAINVFFETKRVHKIINVYEAQNNNIRDLSDSFDEIQEKTFYLSRIYDDYSKLVIEMTHITKPGPKTSLHIFANTNKGGEVVFNVKFTNSQGYLIEQHNIRLPKPIILEGIYENVMLIRLSCVIFIATNELYRYLMDYISLVKKPPPFLEIEDFFKSMDRFGKMLEEFVEFYRNSPNSNSDS